MKTPRLPSKRSRASRTLVRRHHRIPPEWAWHFRTLLVLRDHLANRTGDRLREPSDAMEPPSLHAEDLFDELYDRELAEALPPIPVEALREVEAALHRPERGTYGSCEATGRPIPKPRLRAMPWCRYSSSAAARRVARNTPLSKSHATQ
jgi:RNA polymerase-binding transcription factor DksA